MALTPIKVKGLHDLIRASGATVESAAAVLQYGDSIAQAILERSMRKLEAALNNIRTAEDIVAADRIGEARNLICLLDDKALKGFVALARALHQ